MCPPESMPPRGDPHGRGHAAVPGAPLHCPVPAAWGGSAPGRVWNLQMLAEDDDLNNDSPVFQQTLLCHRLLPPHWITEKLAQWQAGEGVETHGLEEGQWGHSHLAEQGSLEALVSRKCSTDQIIPHVWESAASTQIQPCIQNHQGALGATTSPWGHRRRSGAWSEGVSLLHCTMSNGAFCQA